MDENLKPHRPASAEAQERKREMIEHRQAMYQGAKDLQGQVKDLREMAETDPLTGLLNRRGFENRAQAILGGLSQQRRLQDPSHLAGVIMCDIDHFKSVNDTLGHEGGDSVLRDFSSVLRSNVRPGDIVARFGGEEFAILVVDGDPEHLAHIADGLRERIEGLGTEVNGRIITMSFGVESVTDAGDLGGALSRADSALYKAKEGGRNQVVSYENNEKAA